MTSILIIGAPTGQHPPVAPLLSGAGYAVSGPAADIPLPSLVEREQPAALLIDARQSHIDARALLAAWRACSVAYRPALLLADAPIETDADALLLAPWEPAELLATLRGLLRACPRLAELQGRVVQQAVLVRLLEAANTATSPQQLAPVALDCLVQVTGVRQASLWLFERGTWACLAAHGLPDGPPRRLTPVDGPLAQGALPYSQADYAGLLPLVDDGQVVGAVQLDCTTLGSRERAQLDGLVGLLARAFQRIQRHERAEQQYRRLEQIDQKKYEYISLISHEIKNPMASIKGYSDLLLRRACKTPDDPNRKGLEIISQQVGRITALLNQLLDFSRINTNRLTLDLEWVDLAAMLEHLVEEWRGTTSQHHLRLELEEPVLITSLDQLRICQAIGNLLGNAIKYSPPGSTITVRAARIDGEAQVEALISVSDEGIGIPASDREYLFERFFRGSNVDDEHGGMGLGLFITHEIVQQHGGQLRVESVEGHGTTFSIVLPLVSSPLEVIR